MVRVAPLAAPPATEPLRAIAREADPALPLRPGSRSLSCRSGSDPDCIGGAAVTAFFKLVAFRVRAFG